MGTAFTPAKTFSASWDAFSAVDAFVDAVLAELAAMAADGTRSTRSGPKPPLTGAALRKAIMATWCVAFCGMQWRAIGLLCDIPFGTLYTLFARWSWLGLWRHPSPSFTCPNAGEDTGKAEKVGRTRINEDTTMLKKTVLLGLVISSMASVTSVAVARELTSVGVTVGRLTNPFFVELGKGAETKVKEIAGDKASVTVVAADYDANRQFAQIDDFITSGIDLVLVNAAASNAMEAPLKRLRDAGIVSVAVDVAAEGTDATVTTDNVQAGRNACQFIADRLQGSGNVIIVDGPPVSAVAERIQGCKGVFTQYPDIKILSESQDGRVQSENGFDVATNLLNAFDKIDAIFTINDPEAITVDLAARQLGRKDFFIASVDAAPSVVEALKRQDSLILASSAQDPYLMAQKAVEIGYEILQGRKPAQDVVLIPTELITRDNVAEYKGWTSK